MTFVMAERRAITSGRCTIYVGNSECRIEGDSPTDELRERMSYQDARVASFLRTGEWGKIVERELQQLKDKAQGLAVEGQDGVFRRAQDEQGGVGRARRDYYDAKRAANTVYLYDAMKKTFPTTLLLPALRVIRDAGIEWTIKDERRAPKKVLKIKWDPKDHEQRDYQDHAVDVGLHCRTGVFALATNAGKTDVMLRLTAERRLKTLILVQKQELLFQIHDAIRKHLSYHSGLLGGGEHNIRPITVAIVNSAHIHVQELTKYGFDQVFVDEGHHAASRIHFTVINKLKPYAIYSMTGTDFRTNRAENVILRAAFGGTFLRIDNKFMVEEGYSAKLQAEILKCRQKMHPSMTWRTVYNQAILNSMKRTKLLCDAVAKHAKAGKTVLLLTDQTPHGKTMLQYLIQAGIDARFMHGGKGRAERAAARLEFKDRKFQVLVGTTIYDEGVDFPTLDVVAFAGGKKAKGKVLQRLGRGQRKGFHADGTRKDTAVIIDVYDEGHNLLKKHSLRRLMAMRDAGVELPEDYEEKLILEGYIHAESVQG